MDLFEVYTDIAKISDGLMENKIEFTYDALMGVMGACRPSEQLDIILTKIDWENSSPDLDMLSEALDELVDFNNCFNIKELKGPMKRLQEFLSDNK